jgi:nitroimidazol reductase NimA-like FMN-containing flavoprotein (pyridoxamine 5'-phosphate oxidase superfamily)
MQPAAADAPMTTPIVEISTRECLALLRTEQVGRLAVVVCGRPEIFPVNYALDASDSVILRTAAGTKLTAALNNPVAFEVDRIEADTHGGWSVVVHAVAHQTQRVAPGDRPLRSWRQGASQLVRLAHTSISGRRIGPGTAPVE